MVEHKRIKNRLTWVPMDKRITFPPRKPELRKPLFWLCRAGDELYFVNDSEETLETVSASTGGFQSIDDGVLPVGGGGYVYEKVKPREAVKIEEFDPILDSDFLFQVEIRLQSTTQGGLTLLSPPQKGGIDEAVLLWDIGEAGKYVSVQKSKPA